MTAMVEAGVDVIILETFQQLAEMRIALTLVKKLFDGPVIASMSFTDEPAVRRRPYMSTTATTQSACVKHKGQPLCCHALHQRERRELMTRFPRARALSHPKKKTYLHKNAHIATIEHISHGLTTCELVFKAFYPFGLRRSLTVGALTVGTLCLVLVCEGNEPLRSRQGGCAAEAVGCRRRRCKLRWVDHYHYHRLVLQAVVR